jgi:hypothetical protein
MPLLRGRPIGYDTRRMTFYFTMLTPDARTIECNISNSAIALLGGNRWKSPQEPNIAFELLRDQIEQLASNMYDRHNSDQIQIFAKHVDTTKR